MNDFGQFSAFPAAAPAAPSQPSQPSAQFADFNAFQAAPSSSGVPFPATQPLLAPTQVGNGHLFVTQRLIATSQTRNAVYYFKMFGCFVICFLCCNVIAGQWISSHACPQYGGTSAPAYISGTPAPLNTVFPLSLLQSKLYY